MTMLLFFEVMDKEPPISMIWGVLLFFGLLGFFLSLLRHYLAMVGLGGVALYAIGIMLEIHDPFVGPAIRNEAPGYVPQAYAAIAIGLALPILGAILKLRRLSKHPL